ncbi:unnamed protein product [Prorocentrum cordatum]|uniref:Uncharacterized protein n=1 Tax=Prorocentrum cordatum TaxID=2364126 RepID=A0ABN9XH75_9DINO|nr:unnamed protein product [Polarella glacialis]
MGGKRSASEVSSSVPKGKTKRLARKSAELPSLREQQEYDGGQCCICRAHADRGFVVFSDGGLEIPMCCDDAGAHCDCFSYTPAASLPAAPRNDEDGIQEKWNFAKRNRAKPSAERDPITVATVIKNDTQDIRVYRKWLAMNETEYSNVFGKRPLVKDTSKLPKLNVPCEADPRVKETVFLFAWEPNGPLRTVETSSTVGPAMETVMLDPACCYYKGQGKDFDKWSVDTDKRLAGDELGHVMNSKCPTILEMGAQLGAPELSEQSVVGDGLGESASQVGGDADQGDQADVYIKKLNLEVALRKGKDGVAFHHAGLRVKSWSAKPDTKEMAEKLHTQMKDYVLAASLKPDPIERLPPDQLQKACDRVESLMTIPTAVQLDTWGYDATSRRTKVTFPVDVPKFLAHCWPWPIRCKIDSGMIDPRTGEFDPLEPRLMLVGGEFPVKLEKFRVHFIRSVLGEFMGKGSNGKDFVRATCKHMHDWAESTMEQCNDLGDTSAFLCEITTVAGTIDALFDMEKLLDGDAGENAMNDLKEISDAEHKSSVIKSVALAVANVDFYRDLLATAMTNAAKINDARPKYVDISTDIDAKMQLGPNELASGVEEILKMFPAVIFAVPGQCVKRLCDKTMSIICQVVGIAEAEGEGERGQELVQGALSVLKLGVSCFPMETCIPKWKTELVELMGFGGIENGSGAIVKLEKIEMLVGVISLTGLPDEMQNEILSSLRFMCDGALASYPAPEVDRIGRAIDDVAQSLGMDNETDEQKIAHAMVVGRSAHQLTQTINAMLNAEGQERQEVDTASTATLQFLTEQLTNHSKEIETAKNTEPFLAALTATRHQAIECLRSVGGAKLEEAKSAAAEVIESLRSLQGGLEGAGHWMEGLADNKRNKWADFYEYAQKTITQDRGTAGLKKGIGGATTALARIAETEKAFCLDCGDEFKDDIKQVSYDKVSLRAAIAKHKDAFKQIEGASLGNLPKVLTDRCEQALKFQISV